MKRIFDYFWFWTFAFFAERIAKRVVKGVASECELVK